MASSPYAAPRTAREGEAAADFRERESRARGRGGLLVAAVAEIAEQLLRLMQRQRIAGAHQLLDHVHRAVRDDDVEPAVVVVIEERGAEAGVRRGRKVQSRGRAAVLK